MTRAHPPTSRRPAEGRAFDRPGRFAVLPIPAAREMRGNRRKATVEVSQWPKHVRV